MQAISQGCIYSKECQEGSGNPFQYSCIENPMNSMKRQKDRTLKDELPRSVRAQYATRDQWRNNSRKNERTEPKQKQHAVVDVTGDRSKVRYYNEEGLHKAEEGKEAKIKRKGKDIHNWMQSPENIKER